MARGRLQLVLSILTIFIHFNNVQQFYKSSGCEELSSSRGATIFATKQKSHLVKDELLYRLYNRKLTTSVCKQTTADNLNDSYLKPFYLLQLLILSGDIEVNPGPIKFPCQNCAKPVKSNQKAIQCDFCDIWVHLKCTRLTTEEYRILENSDETYFCEVCIDRLPNFTDSFFKQKCDENQPLPHVCVNINNLEYYSINSTSIPTSPASDSEYEYDIFDELSEMRKKHTKKFICAYLNINSLRNKISHIKELLQKGTVDMLFIAETKIDNSFVDSQFRVDNYTLWRADRTANGGGIAAYLRSDIAGERKKELEFEAIESIDIQI